MQAQGSLLQGSMMANFINIYQNEGTRGLWRVSAYVRTSRSFSDKIFKHVCSCVANLALLKVPFQNLHPFAF